MSVFGAVGSPVGMVRVATRPRAVKDPPPAAVATVILTPPTVSTTVGAASQQVSVALKDAGNNTLTDFRTVSYGSDDTGVCTVTPDPTNPRLATLTFVGEGTATITATCEGQTDTCAVTVSAAVSNTAPAMSTTGPYSGTAGQAVRFSAQGSFDPDLAGAGSTFTVAWDPGDGSGFSAEFPGTNLVAPNGYIYDYVYSTPGTYTVRCRGTDGLGAQTIVQTTCVVTDPGSSTVATLDLNPASASVPEGSIQQVRAEPRNSAGLLLTGRTVTWENSNPSVVSLDTTTGDPYRADATILTSSGSATITATCEGEQATCVITAIPVPGGGSAGPNQPAGHTTISEDECDAVSGAVITGGNYSYFPFSGSVVTDSVASAPRSAPAVLKGTWNAGLGAGKEPFERNTPVFAPLREMYMRLRIRFNRNASTGGWMSHGAGEKLLGFFGVGEFNNKYNQMYFQGVGAISQTQNVLVQNFRLELRLQGYTFPPSRSQNVSSSRIQLDVWSDLEFLWVLNTVGQSNGIFRYWLNGELCSNYTDVAYLVGSNTRGFHRWKWRPTFGGAASYPSKSQTDTAHLDHVFISGILQ